MPTSNHNFDHDHLADLLATFPVPELPPLSVEEARKKISARHDVLSWENLGTILEVFPEERFFDKIPLLPKIIHRILFHKIFNNAGIYRKLTDPGGGLVRFGPSQIYEGTHPDYIEEKVDQSIDLLVQDSSDLDPVLNGLKFYQQFVYIHPFYDGNGRIGRFIISLYFHYHRYIVDWSELTKNQKWLKKLNDCHNRMNATPDVYELYVGYMVSYWRRFIYPFPEEDE